MELNHDDIELLIEDCGMMERTPRALERLIATWENDDSVHSRNLVKAYRLALRRKRELERVLGVR